MNQGNNAQQQRVNINIDELQSFTCEQCGGKQFAPVFGIKAISALVSPTGQAGSLNYQTGFMCTSCGTAYGTQQIADACKKMLEGPALITLGEELERSN